MRGKHSKRTTGVSEDYPTQWNAENAGSIAHKKTLLEKRIRGYTLKGHTVFHEKMAQNNHCQDTLV